MGHHILALLRRFAVAALALLFAVQVAAAPFSSLVIFGDSLSDVGNLSKATFGIYPGSAYYSGRFSNGPVYAETLSLGLGVGALARSSSGGSDFAYGGALTTGTYGDTVVDIDEQLDQFFAMRTVDPTGLYLVFAGANDLLNDQIDFNTPVDNLAGDLGRLINAGARQFLVPNLPLLGLVPRFNSNPATKTQYNTLATNFNAALATALNNLANTNPDVTFYRLDVAGLIGQAVADPASFGLTNVTDSAAPGLSPGLLFYNKNRIVAHPNEYLFWDDLHPTTAVHAILAQRALSLLALPGDFNHDHVVDAADYSVWRDSFGQTGLFLPADGNGDGIVDGGDFAIWKSRFGAVGAIGSGGVASSATVPEPSSAILWVIAAALTIVRRIRHQCSRV